MHAFIIQSLSVYVYVYVCVCVCVRERVSVTPCTGATGKGAVSRCQCHSAYGDESDSHLLHAFPLSISVSSYLHIFNTSYSSIHCDLTYLISSLPLPPSFCFPAHISYNTQLDATFVSLHIFHIIHNWTLLLFPCTYFI